MRNIPDTFEWEKALDPSDIDYRVIDVTDLLDTGEQAINPVVTPYGDAVDLGLQVIGASPRQISVINSGKQIKVWFQIDPLKVGSPQFKNEGSALALSVSFDTDSAPSRHLEGTAMLRVKEQ